MLLRPDAKHSLRAETSILVAGAHLRFPSVGHLQAWRNQVMPRVPSGLRWREPKGFIAISDNDSCDHTHSQTYIQRNAMKISPSFLLLQL